MKTGEETGRAVARFMIAILCGGALLLILLIASGSSIDEDSARAIGTAIALAFFSLTGVAGTNLARRRPELTWFGYLTVLASAVAVLMMLGAIWSDDNWEAAAVALIFAFAGAHASLLITPAGDEGNARLVRNGTLVALALLVAMSTVAIAGGEIGPQPIAVVAVLYALGTIVLALLRRTAPVAPAASLPALVPQGPGDLPLDHLCLAWDGNAETAVEHLRRQGFDLVMGPVPSAGSSGAGQSVYYRDADGSLIELIAYG